MSQDDWKKGPKDAADSSVSAILSTPERNMRVSRSSLGLLMAGLPAQSWRNRRVSPDGALGLTPVKKADKNPMPVIQDVHRNVSTSRAHSYSLETRSNSRVIMMYLRC